MRIIVCLGLVGALLGCRGKEDTAQNPGPIIPAKTNRGTGMLAFADSVSASIQVKGFTVLAADGQITLADSALTDRQIQVQLPTSRLPRASRTYAVVNGVPQAGQVQVRLTDLSPGTLLAYSCKGGEQLTLIIEGRKVSATLGSLAMLPNTTLNPPQYRTHGTLAATFTFVADSTQFE